ncbi:MAG: hypothetical protein D3905_09605 [Candidatus Electrothrix sp. AS4_5]|nr:hypothetical protein [Candidatus Electrothrix gigas]MCI5190031.1 hypothetical protein [Candidatus Electrothrix gigas]
MKYKLSFTTQELVNRIELLEEALEIIAYGDVRLGEKKSAEAADEAKQQLLEKIKGLQQEQIRFSPKLDTRIIDPAEFQESGKEISRDLQAKMEEYDFHQVFMPVTLKSKVGWAFSRLECELRFCDGEIDNSQLPVVYDMFPKDDWVDVLKAGIDCTVTLDEQMQFSAIPEEPTEFVQSQAGAEFQTTIKSFLTTSFRYRLRRPKIKARGKLDTVCFWQLDGKECVDEENVLLAVLLMVPKTRKRPIDVTVEAIAYHDFQFLTADIFSGYFKEFDEKLKSFFQTGVPLRAESSWQNVLS